MIIPNLVVSDVGRSIRFYQQVLGAEIVFSVTAERVTTFDDAGLDDAVFGCVKMGDAELMLQSVASLNQELPEHFPLGSEPTRGGTIYMRGVDPRPIASRVPKGQLVDGPRVSWYGMMEMYVEDPDGHLICLGINDGPPPEV